MRRSSAPSLFFAAFSMSSGVGLLCVTLVAWLLCSMSLHRPHIGDFMDDGEYIVAAQSLRDGHGYRLPSRPSSPPETKYPAGLSLVAAAFLPPKQVSLESDFRRVRALTAVAALIFGTTGFAALRLLAVPGIAAVCCIALTLWSDLFINHSTTLLSDIPFAACCTVMVLIWTMIRCGKVEVRGRVGLLLGVVAGVGLTLRSSGMGLALAFLVLAFEAPRRWRFFACYLIGVVLAPSVTHQIARTVSDTAPSEPYSVNWVAYTSLQTGVAIVLRNVVDYATALPLIFVPELSTNALGRHPTLALLIRLAVWVAVIRGAWLAARRIRRVDAAPVLFALLTVGTCLIWPWPMYLRPMIPFIPFIIAGTVFGAWSLVSWPRAGVALAFAGLLALTGAQLTMTVRALRYPSGAFDEALAYIRLRTEPDAVIVGHLPETTYLYSGRQAIRLLNDRDRISGNLGNWKSIDDWDAVARGRPFYLMGPAPTGVGNDDLAKQVWALSKNAAPGRLQEVFRTADGEWVIFKLRGISPG